MDSRSDVSSTANRTRRVFRAVPWLVLALMLGATAAAGYAYNVTLQESQLIPRGLSVAGIPVGGLSPEAALPVVQTDLDARLGTVITLEYGDEHWDARVGDLVGVSPETTLSEAHDVRSQQDVETLLRHDLLGEPIERDILYDYTIEDDRVAALVDEIGDALDTDPVEPAMFVENGELVVVKARAGTTVDRLATEQALRSALGSAMTSVRAVGDEAEPAPTVAVSALTVDPESGEDALSRTAILVNLTSKRLSLYEDGELSRVWPIATGAPGFPTPSGDFVITLKRYMPTWGNPGSAWAADMPKTIPPGPTNPLGLRALNLNVPGIRIHGTSNLASLGTAASHGCVRMANSAVVELYDLVEVGTPVFIFR